jgi:hypothetical protein
MSDAYLVAQEAMAKLKSSVWLLLKDSPDGLTNAAIGRSLGIYAGHIGHEGHISRTLLSLMEAEGVVEQDTATKAWTIRKHIADAREASE